MISGRGGVLFSLALRFMQNGLKIICYFILPSRIFAFYSIFPANHSHAMRYWKLLPNAVAFGNFMAGRGHAKNSPKNFLVFTMHSCLSSHERYYGSGMGHFVVYCSHWNCHNNCLDCSLYNL